MEPKEKPFVEPIPDLSETHNDNPKTRGAQEKATDRYEEGMFGPAKKSDTPPAKSE